MLVVVVAEVKSMIVAKSRSVLIVVWEFPPGPGGIGQHAYSLALALSRGGMEVEIITSGDYASEVEIRQFDSDNRTLSIHRIRGSRPILYFKRLKGVVWRVLKRKPSMVFLSGKAALWCCLMIKPFLPRESKVYGFVHGSEIQISDPIVRKLTHCSMRRVDELVCVSNFTKSLLQRTVENPGSVSVLANGLSLSLLPTAEPDPLKAIRDKGYPRLLTVGRISPRKGQFRVVKALPYLRTLWPDIHYHIVGLDYDKGALIALAKSLGVEDHITIHGTFPKRDELYRAYCSADVFIMLSQNQADGDVEGFGIAILEANYFGVPAIGSRGCGIEDAIQDDTNGYLVDGDNAKEIAEALHNCITKDSLRSGAKAWARKHDWDRLVSRFYN